jgi:citrate synthase
MTVTSAANAPTDPSTAATAQLRIGERTFEFPIVHGTDGYPAINLSTLLKETGMTALDYGYADTSPTRSAITYLDGEAGILRYRGYPIEQLAERSTFLETAYLVIHGELPTEQQLADWTAQITRHTLLHEEFKRFFEGFPMDAHPMGILASAVAALSTFYQQSDDPKDPADVDISTVRLIAKMPTIAAFAYKKSVGQPFMYPDNSLEYEANFLNMMFALPSEPYKVDPDAAHALRVLLILHADHEQNCSTSTVRMVGSSLANMYASISAGISALWGPLHGGANQEVLQMLEAIAAEGGNVGKFVDRAKDHQGRGPLDPGQARCARSAAGHRAGAREGGPQRPVLHRPQALPQRRLLQRPDLSRAGSPDRDVHSHVCHRPAAGLDRPVARDDDRSRFADRPPAPAVRRRGRARLPADRGAVGAATSLSTA